MKKAVCFMLLLSAAGWLRAADAPRRLTLREAEDIALAQHPRISVANLQALAAQQSVKQSRAAFFPNIGVPALRRFRQHANFQGAAFAAA